MAGHSKWSKIKRKKGANDAKRSKLFSKLIREITVAAREGGGDISANPRLRLAVDTAKSQSMPGDNIDRAIKKGSGAGEGSNYEETTYEGYGPGGVAIFLEVLTDNKNRTLPEIRHLFSKYNGNLGENGCVSYLFEKKGLIEVSKDGIEEEALMDIAIESGASDVEDAGDQFEVYTEPGELHNVTTALQDKELQIKSAAFTRIPSTSVEVSGKTAETLLKLIDFFEDHDDVQNVYANFDISDAELDALES